jgi:N-acetylmuramoyl-L-alanine amidase
MNNLARNLSTAAVIVLDPGHGGTEAANGSQANNALGPNGLLEKDLTLAIAQAAAQMLRSARRQVVLTRSDDQNLSLAARAAVACEHHAAVFVSIHLNGHPDTAIDGAEAYIAPQAGEMSRKLADQLLQSVALATRVPPRGIQTADFTVLATTNHLPQTAACLIEVAFLTNPAQAQRLAAAPYVQQLGLALAQGIMSYTAAQPVGQSLSNSQGSERLIYNAPRDHRDPPNLLPEPDRGQDVHTITIPTGQQFSRWEVDVENTSPRSGYRIISSPQAGAAGSQQVTVEWWFGPYGRITYRLRAYASPDGRSNPTPIIEGQTGWTDKVRDQMQQGLPITLGVRGPQAQALQAAVEQHPDARSVGNLTRSMDGGVISGPVIIAIVVVIAIVIALGMITIGALLKQAMDQGYDVQDTRYKAAAGSGETRQEHEFLFNLRPPGSER